MTKIEISTQIQKIINDISDEILFISSSSIINEFKHWDSLNYFTLEMDIEDYFDISFKTGEFASFKTINDIIDNISTKL